MEPGIDLVGLTQAQKDALVLRLRDRQHLFVFVTDRNVPPTNNISERDLRPSVIFRKVTSGFRTEWGSETYAAFQTIASTAKLNGKTILNAVTEALALTGLL